MKQETTKRICLKCDEEFLSKEGLRLCPGCNNANNKIKRGNPTRGSRSRLAGSARSESRMKKGSYGG